MQNCQENKAKICSRCGKELPVTEFYKDYRCEGRLKSICKHCWSQRQKRYRSEHKEKISDSNKQYYCTNKEKINMRIGKWRKDNHQKLMEQQRIRRERANVLMYRLKTPCVKCGETRPWVIQFHH